MKILVISDNHGDQAILEKVFTHFHDTVDAIFHCGDSEMAVTNPLFDDVQVVKGNNDYGTTFADDVSIQGGTDQVFMTHGDLYGVNMGLTHLSLKAQEMGATLVFYGHTHQLAAEFVQGRLYLNPGSISLPRGEFANLGGTFAIVTTMADQLQVDFYDRQLKRVSSLHQVFSR